MDFCCKEQSFGFQVLANVLASCVFSSPFSFCFSYDPCVVSVKSNACSSVFVFLGGAYVLEYVVSVFNYFYMNFSAVLSGGLAGVGNECGLSNL